MIENYAEFVCPSCTEHNLKEFAQIYNFIFKPDDECKLLCEKCKKVNIYHVESVTYRFDSKPRIATEEDAIF